MNKKLHKCWVKCEESIKRGYGVAVDMCSEDKDDSLWVSNGEYGNRVNYCPFCGYKAPNQYEFKKETI